MSDGLRIRAGVEADAPLIAQLIDELNADQGEETGHVTAAAVRRDGFGERPEFLVLLAELDGEPVGYALFHPTWSTEVGARGYYLYDLYVRGSARGHGVGRALMVALAHAAAADGRSFLWWSSKAWNTAAQAFYGRLGALEEAGKSHALDGDPLLALLREPDPRRQRPP